MTIKSTFIPKGDQADSGEGVNDRLRFNAAI
jgi:hypothetical protein